MEIRPVDAVARTDLAAFQRSVWRAEFVVAHGERIDLHDELDLELTL